VRERRRDHDLVILEWPELEPIGSTGTSARDGSPPSKNSSVSPVSLMLPLVSTSRSVFLSGLMILSFFQASPSRKT
jgi:hypothetical protein